MASKGRTCKHLRRNQKLAARAKSGAGTENLEEVKGDAFRDTQQEDSVNLREIFLNFRASCKEIGHEEPYYSTNISIFSLTWASLAVFHKVTII